MLTGVDLKKKRQFITSKLCYNAKEIQRQLLWKVNDFSIGKLYQIIIICL